MKVGGKQSCFPPTRLLYDLLFIFLLPFRIHREPAFQYAFALFEDLLDGPERRE